MNVSAGFNTAFGREKFDVILEPGDLPRILDEHNIDVAVADKLSVTFVFRLLNYQAQIICNQMLVFRLTRLSGLANFNEEDRQRLEIAKVDLSNNQNWLAGLLTEIRAGKTKPGQPT